MRSQQEVMEEIAEATPEERAALHARVQRMNLPPERKKRIHDLMFFLGLIDEIERPLQ